MHISRSRRPIVINIKREHYFAFWATLVQRLFCKSVHHTDGDSKTSTPKIKSNREVILPLTAQKKAWPAQPPSLNSSFSIPELQPTRSSPLRWRCCSLCVSKRNLSQAQHSEGGWAERILHNITCINFPYKVMAHLCKVLSLSPETSDMPARKKSSDGICE